MRAKLFFALCALVVTLLVGTGNAAAVSVPGEKFVIGTYPGLFEDCWDEEQFDYMKDAHINVMSCCTNDALDSTDVQQMLDWAVSRGIKLQVYDDRTYSMSWSQDPDITHAEIDAVVDDISSDFKDDPAIEGYFVGDEPGDQTMIENMAYMYNRYLYNHPGSNNFLNLMPIYGFSSAAAFASHIQQNIDAIGASNVDYLGVDIYPFPTTAGTIRSDYFQNNEIYRSVCLANGIDKISCFIQSAGWSGSRLPNANELRWNVYTNIAYGMKAMYYFVWNTPGPAYWGGTDPGVIDRYGNKTSLYTPAQTVNGEIEKLGPTLMSLDSIEVYHKGGTLPAGTTEVPANYFWSPTATSYPQIISHFIQKGTGNHYVMVVNNDIANTRTLSFNLASKPVSVTEISKSTGQPVSTNYSSSTGNISASFSAGEGKLYLISDDFGLINDTNGSITYSGTWTQSTNRGLGDYTDDVYFTTTDNDYFQYTFTGTGIDYITEKNSDMGDVDIYIDNVFQQTVSCYNVSRLVQQTVYKKTGLSYGSHTLKVVKKNGTYAVLLDALRVYADIQNNTGYIQYTGSWYRDYNRGIGEYGDDLQVTTANGDYFQCTFTGTGIDYITTKDFNRGNVSIYIDGTFDQTISCYNASSLVQQVVYSRRGLNYGKHTIKAVKVSGMDVDALWRIYD